MNSVKPLTFFELVRRPCSLTYGTAPCTASVGVTGTRKCYNSPRTCQDQANYTLGDEEILRFAEPTEDLPIEIDAIPCITDISRRPQMLNPGESIGTRESVNVDFHNFRHNDVGFDKYLDDRGYNPYNKGTFWGKFFARWGNIQGIEARTVDGFVGQAYEDMTKRYYVVESMAGPDSKGNVSITVKDVLKLLDGDKAQFPPPSPGSLASSITTASSSLTLTPTGVGDASYPASGIASMGDELVSFTRSGDTVTLTARGLNGSELDDHDDGETFQIGYFYDGETPAFLLNTFITNGSDVPAEYINLTAWEAECDTHIGRLFSGYVMRPTPIKTLCDELIQEVGLTFYSDVVNKNIVMQSMRQLVPVFTIDDDLYIAGSITSKQSNDKRVSEVWIYYGQKNPLEAKTQKKNYRAIYAQPTSNPVVALEQTPSAIREVMSRWITVFNRPAAAELADLLLRRYEISPRQIAFSLHPNIPVGEGQSIKVKSRIFENDTGEEADHFMCQIIQIDRKPEKISILAEEISIAAQEADDGVFRVYIDTDVFNIHLRDVFNSIYSEPVSGDEVQFIFSSGVKIGSLTTSAYAMQVGGWPSGVIVKLMGDSTNRIQGRGGDGATGSGSGGFGGGALFTLFDIEIIGDFKIYGGGGGGGNNFNGFEYTQGGGGAGYVPGYPDATIDEGGFATGIVSQGGNPGEDGEDIPAGTNGGIAGVAVNGASFVTYTGTPDIRGDEIN